MSIEEVYPRFRQEDGAKMKKLFLLTIYSPLSTKEVLRESRARWPISLPRSVVVMQMEGFLLDYRALKSHSPSRKGRGKELGKT